jgi:beta-phosphoglucomutase-like phosphatase (HAD superfamily)
MNRLRQLRDQEHSIHAVFVDDGGVLNDNSLRAPEYLRLIGEFMSRRLGGSAEQWADANREVFPPLWSDLQSRIMDFANHREYQREYELLWIDSMCSLVGTRTPPEDIATSIVREAYIYVSKHARAEIEGAADSILKLFRAGYSLYSASGTPSWELKEIFKRMGIRDAFSDLFGPDLVDHVKYGAEFYDRIFKQANVSPSECIVIESSKEACGWAGEAGALAIWVDCSHTEAYTLSEVVEALLKCR